MAIGKLCGFGAAQRRSGAIDALVGLMSDGGLPDGARVRVAVGCGAREPGEGPAMFKYVVCLIGIVCLYFSVTGWITFKPLDSEAKMITLAEARDVGGAEDVRYVTFDAALDTDHRIYRTGLTEPFFTANDPAATYGLKIEDIADQSMLDGLLGCVVRVEAPLDPVGSGTMQVIREHEDDEKPDELESEKVFGPLLGSGGRLLALSPTYRKDDHAANMWRQRTTFTGRLSRLRDMSRNAEGVTHEVSELVATMRGWGANLPNDAYVILTEKGTDNGHQRHLIPVTGTDYTVFLDVTDESEARFAEAGTITGVMRTMHSRGYVSAAHALGVEFPERIAILSDQTAEAYNTGKRTMYTAGTVFGLFMTISGGFIIWLKRFLKAQRRRRIEAVAAQTPDEWRLAA
jgi:hypothetical protein